VSRRGNGWRRRRRTLGNEIGDHGF
jgi:hypothetical protein